MASLCKNLSDFVADNYAIIYMDFADEVQELLRCLRKLHELEVKCFHEKGMSIEKKNCGTRIQPTAISSTLCH